MSGQWLKNDCFLWKQEKYAEKNRECYGLVHFLLI